jgi:hypothetical protein
MKTLLFCTSYAANLNEWEGRYKKWLNFHREYGPRADCIAIIDDGSPVLPEWKTESDRDGKIIHFPNNLGRQAHLEYPGWYRSFAYASKMAKRDGYEKVIHVESDAFLVSKRICEWVDSLTHGWHVMWCPKHNFHESAIQVICSDQIEAYSEFCSKDYEAYRGQLMDRMFPYTQTHKEFNGDRYGEYLSEIPLNADYACQVRDDWGVSHFENHPSVYLTAL